MEAVPGPRQLSWQVEHHTGDAGGFHGRQPTPASGARLAWVSSTTARAVVLGSGQRDQAVNRRVADALGIAVVRRRSGGGAVLVLPGEVVWIDLIVTADDPLWHPDVGRAMHWVGEAWATALGSLGVVGHVHRGALVRTDWSGAVCFAGIGAGEVLDGSGRKLVGVSQRRTRGWARFQTMCHLRWRPEVVAALVAAPHPSATAIARSTATVAAGAVDVVDALIAALP